MSDTPHSRGRSGILPKAWTASLMSVTPASIMMMRVRR